MDLERKAMPMGEKPALVLVDMINGFTHSECPLGTDCPEVVEANQKLLAVFREKGLPIFYTTVVYHDETQARVFRDRVDALNVLSPDSDWVKIDDRVAMQEGEVLIEKRWASSFFGTDLAEQMRAQGCDSVVVTGLTTSGCVRATVVDGLQSDFRVFVAREAVGDRNMDAHEANLFDMHAKYAEVMSLDEVVAQIK